MICRNNLVLPFFFRTFFFIYVIHFQQQHTIQTNLAPKLSRHQEKEQSVSPFRNQLLNSIIVCRWKNNACFNLLIVSVCNKSLYFEDCFFLGRIIEFKISNFKFQLHIVTQIYLFFLFVVHFPFRLQHLDHYCLMNQLSC